MEWCNSLSGWLTSLLVDVGWLACWQSVNKPKTYEWTDKRLNEQTNARSNFLAECIASDWLMIDELIGLSVMMGNRTENERKDRQPNERTDERATDLLCNCHGIPVSHISLWRRYCYYESSWKRNACSPSQKHLSAEAWKSLCGTNTCEQHVWVIKSVKTRDNLHTQYSGASQTASSYLFFVNTV